MYPYQGRSQGQGQQQQSQQQQQQQQQQQPPPPSSSSNYGRRPSASHSPEQSRASIGRSVPPHSPGGMSAHSHHGSAAEEERWHHRPPPPDMRDMHYPPPPPHQSRYGGGGREREEYGNRPPPPHGHHPPPPPWMDDRGYPGAGGSAGGRQSSSNYAQSHGPPPQRMMDDRMGGPPPGRTSSGYIGSTGPSYSHPPSPSRRPRTPPPISRSSGQAAPGGRAAPWDTASNGPMSAPPSIVPRMPTGTSSSGNGAAGSSSGLQRPGSQITSPSLPGLSSRDPGNGHQRAPSWGPHTNTGNENSSVGGLGGGNRGASVDAYGRSNDPSSRPLESRKRPASESPPTHSTGRLPPQQSSPSQQRGDVMSMSSILGPSGGRAPSGPPPDMSLVNNNGGGSAEKRRRLEGGQSASSVSPSKAESNTSSGNGGASRSNQQMSISEAAAANLARRKWSGPIAEEAAQQAAAWRAQEQRWGTGASRSPKVGSLALSNGGGERHTSPFGAAANNFPGRGASPSVPEGHRRQRSDGLAAPPHNGPIDARSPLARSAPLRGPSPPQPSRAAKQQQQQGPPPPHAFGGGAPPGYYRGASPPPPPHPQDQQGAPMHGGPPPQQHFGGQQGHPPPPHAYGQPGYHAYDSQGRPVEIDLDEVRGGAFAGHGSPAPLPPGHLNDPGFRHGMAPPSMPPPLPQSQYEEQQQRGRMAPPPQQQQQQQQQAPPPVRRDGGPPQQGVVKGGQPGKPTANPPPHAYSGKSGGAPMQQQQGRSQQQQQQTLRERESKANLRRSVTPIVPGPAKGLLPARVDFARSAATTRPRYPSKDFSSGPKVDSDAVWAALREADTQARERDDRDAEAVAADDAPTTSPPIGRHLGSFLYDARKSVLLPGEMLRRNIGATLEIRVPGQLLGVGPMDVDEEDDAATAKKKRDDRSGVRHGRWALGPKAVDGESAPPEEATSAIAKEDASVSVEEQEADGHAFWKFDAALQRKAWGTDVYTDDSDVVMMCLHSGWLQGPHTDDVPSWVPPGKATLAWRRMTNDLASRGIGFDDESNGTTEPPLSSDVSPEWLTRRAARLQRTADLSVTLRVAPKLIAYKGSQRGGVKTRSWGNTHDGVSLMVEHVTLRRAGYASGERGLRSMKQRIDQLARLRMLANIAGDEQPAAAAEPAENKTVETTKAVAAAARQHMLAGGLLDILAAARLMDKEAPSAAAEAVDEPAAVKHFWQFDPLVHVKAA